MILSPRQKAAILAEDGNACFVGSVRSGKSFAASLSFANHSLEQRPGDYMHLVAGRSPTQLKQEVLPHLQDHCRTLGLPSRWNGSERVLYAGGHKFGLFAWSNEKSVDRIMGLTIGNAMVEEAVLVSLDFWRGVQSRLTFDWSRILGTTNPASPAHWLKGEIDDGRTREWRFTFTDNPSLKPATIRRFHNLYPRDSVHYRRFVLAQWAASQGLIYKVVPISLLPPRGKVVRTFAGCDFGMTAPTSVVRVEVIDDGIERRYWITHSLEIAASREVSVMPSAQAERIAQFHRAHPFEVVYVDPSAALKAELRDKLPCAVRDARSEVSPGLATVDRLFNAGKLQLRDHTDTKELRGEIAGYVWDPKKQDQPLKEDDHHCDALRYGVHSYDRQAPAILF